MAIHASQKSNLPLSLVTLSSGSSLCTIAPHVGGSIASWHVDGQPMLRSAASGASDPRDMASFPLVPFSNRIAHGRFSWEGQDYGLARLWESEAHPIHGVGAMRPWTLQLCDDCSATLHLDHAPDDYWPFAFRAEQVVMVGEESLTILMTAYNLEDRAVPLAMAHHPYFDVAGATMRMSAATLWLNDRDGLPGSAVSPTGDYDFSDGASVAGRAIDNCFTGWDGSVDIEWMGRSRRLSIHATTTGQDGTAPLSSAVVYIPQGRDFFCVEPVPHLTDAINRPDCGAPMPVIAPGEVFMSVIQFDARQVKESL